MNYTTDLEKLRLEMFKKKASQEKIARVLNIAKASVCRKLNSQTEFTVSEAQKICEYLDVDPTEIFFISSVPNMQHNKIM